MSRPPRPSTPIVLRALLPLAVIFPVLHPCRALESIGDLEPITLRRAVEIALGANPGLLAHQGGAEAARARVGAARAAGLPRLDLAQGFSRGDDPVYVFGTKLTQERFAADDFALSALNTPDPLDNFQTRLDGEWPVFDFGRSRARLRGARLVASAAVHGVEQARQDLILRVQQSYFGVVVAREAREAARSAVRAAESSEARARAMAEAGLVVESDLLSAQVHTAQMREREIRASNGLAIARLLLAHEMGLPAPRFEPSEALTEPPEPALSEAEYEEAALASRPALLAAESESRAASSQTDLALAEFAPRLGVYGKVERDASTLEGPSGTNWVAGATLGFNLFAGGADRARLEEARASERQASNRLAWVRSGILLEVRQATLELNAARARARSLRGATEQAEESLRILQNRYDAGLVTITELLRAQVTALDARTGYLAALSDWRTSASLLERAAGRLGPDSAVLDTAE